MRKKTREYLIYGSICLIAIAVIVLAIVITVWAIRDKQTAVQSTPVETSDKVETSKNSSGNFIMKEPELEEELPEDILPGVSNKDYETFENAIDRLSERIEKNK